MKKYMIRCDMEGATGIVSYDQADPGRTEYAAGRGWFMSDLLALIDGLNGGGADEIIIYDEHYYGRNIDLTRLPDNARAICGKPPYLRGWAGGLDESFTGVILLGLHAKAGTPGGLLPHSYELDIQDIGLNGISVGEIGMEAAIAGELGIPLILICGDSAAIAETESLIDGAESVVVKKALAADGALCYPPAETSRLIRDAAERAARREILPQPFCPAQPVRLTITLRQGRYLDLVSEQCGARLIEGHTLQFENRFVNDAWADYWQIKRAVCQRMGAN